MQSDTITNATTLDGMPDEFHDSSVKPGAADDNKAFTISCDLQAPHKRYMQLQAKAGDGAVGTLLSAVAIGRHKVRSSEAEDRGTLFSDYAPTA